MVVCAGILRSIARHSRRQAKSGLSSAKYLKFWPPPTARSHAPGYASDYQLASGLKIGRKADELTYRRYCKIVLHIVTFGTVRQATLKGAPLLSDKRPRSTFDLGQRDKGVAQ